MITLFILGLVSGALVGGFILNTDNGSNRGLVDWFKV